MSSSETGTTRTEDPRTRDPDAAEQARERLAAVRAEVAKADRPYRAGKDFLIRNTAALLRYGGHDAEALHRYYTVTVQQVRAIVHTPRDLHGAAQIAWLERIRVARKGTIVLPDLDQWVTAAATDPALARRIPEIAMRIHRWRQEMTHGSDDHP